MWRRIERCRERIDLIWRTVGRLSQSDQLERGAAKLAGMQQNVARITKPGKSKDFKSWLRKIEA